MNTIEKIVFELDNKQVIQQGKKFFTRVLENGEYFESGDFNTLDNAKNNLGIKPTILENNKLVADFMELVPIEYNGNYQFSDGVYFSSSSKDKQEVQNSIYKYVKYSTDWNWLMQVVEKIENLKPIIFLSGRNWIGFEVKIYKTFNTQTNYCTINYLKDSGLITVSNGFSKNSKIEATYNACIEFIKWYNENNLK